MLCYARMRWDLKGMSFDELWDLEGKEAVTGIQTIESGYVKHLYEVVAQQQVVAFADVPSLEDLDRTAMGRLPMHEHLLFEQVWALDELYTKADVPGYLKARRATLESSPRFLFAVTLSWDGRSRALDAGASAIVAALQGAPHTTALGIYRVAAQQRLLALVDVTSAADLNALANLPALEGAQVDEVMGLRDYILFADDVAKHFTGI